MTFPGSNCDDDIVFALGTAAGMQVDRLWHKDSPSLSDYALVVLPGGFSYGDYLRCGAIASLSPVMARVKEYAGSGGHVLGICNGFQILCESRLLPGALARNESLSFVCRDVFLRTETADTRWTKACKVGDVLRVPIAHGEGRYVVEESEYDRMRAAGQVIFTYCDATGEHSEGSNPNGSQWNIAGVCNEKKNVFGLMPHPERASDLRSRDGMKIWQSFLGGVR